MERIIMAKSPEANNTYTRNPFIVMAGLLLCLFQLFIGFPIAVWKRNKFNFEAPLTYSYSVLAITLLVIIIIAIFIAVIIPKKTRGFFASFFAVLALAICVQQNYLNWNYGILDGQTIDFKKNAGIGFIDLVMWAVVFGVFLRCRKFIQRQTNNILIAIGSISLITTAFAISSYGDVDTPYAIDESTKFNFSEKENIIVFLFDAYQTDLFLEIANAQPDLMEPFDGFTIYENNSAVFAKTYPTIPLFLTGKRYQKEEPLLSFFKSAYKDSLMEKMQDEGWDIGLYPNLIHFPALINAIDINPSVMDNAIGGVPSTAQVDTYLQSLDLSLFRAVPHALKPMIFNDGKFVVRRDALKSAYLKIIGQTDVPQPFTYKTKQRHEAVGFRDLMNEHAALTADDVEHEPNFDAFRAYSVAGIKLMGAYLNRLKEIGAYDNSTIIIISDHGMGTRNTRQFDLDSKSYIEIEKYGIQRSAAKSIFLVKHPGDKGLLNISDKPVSGIDVAPTLAAASNITIEGFEGKDVRAVKHTDHRKRIFNYYDFSTWDSKFLDDFETFQIEGHVGDDNSWTRLGMTRANVKIKKKGEYQLGEHMSFGSDVKTDTDHLNDFIELENYITSANYVNAPNGRLDLNITLSDTIGLNDDILLQFEIYSGEKIDRKIIINGVERTALIAPLRRKLNSGYVIPPEIHKGQTSFDLSFRAAGPDMDKPLHLSSVKLSIYDKGQENLDPAIRKFEELRK